MIQILISLALSIVATIAHAQTWTQLQWGVNGSASAYVGANGVIPPSDGGKSLGQASYRWKALYLYPTTVATLTGAISCGATTEVALAAVTDANSTTFNAALAGGGSNHMLTYCNGTGWVVR